MRVLRFEYPFLVLASWIVLLLSRDGVLDRLEGGFFLASMVGFVAYAVWVARKEITPAEQSTVAEAVPEGAERLRRKPTWALASGLAVALVALVLAAQAFVSGAVGMAAALGISERVIGLTVVAIGTSLPELAVSVSAALKKQQEMAVANVVGSNIFNLLMILGTAGLARPLPVEDHMIGVDLWVMVAFAFLLGPLVYRKRTLTRIGGGCLLAAYAWYVASLALNHN
jgi:cation:H+ antiporter